VTKLRITANRPASHQADASFPPAASEFEWSARDDGKAVAESGRRYESIPAAAGSGAAGAIPLSFSDFCERMARVAQLKLPCVVSVAHKAYEHWHRGPLCKIKRTDGRLEVSGDTFAIYLREGNLGAIVLVNLAQTDHDNPVVEVYNRAEQLVARIHSLPEEAVNAHWRAIMHEAVQ
jgi:putative heme degradation protein